MKNVNFKIVTIGMVPFSEDHLEYISVNLGIKPRELIILDSKKRLEIRHQDTESKIEERSKNAYDEYIGALKAEHIIVNPHGEDDKDSWAKRSWGVELVIDQFYTIIRKYNNQKILLVLSGPSCIGKGPLEEVFFNEIVKKENLTIGKCILYVDKIQRPIRNGESEGNPYFYRTLDEINTLINSEPNRFIQFDVRSVKQMIDLEQVNELLIKNDIVFLEIFYTAIPLLRDLVQ